MSDEPRRKKRSEKLSDSFAARLARDVGPANRLDAVAGDGRASGADRTRNRTHDPASLASMQTPARLGFMRCPHCREYVPVRDDCRACGTPMTS